MLGEYEHAQLRVRVLDLARRARALVGEARWHPDVEDDEIGVLLGDRGQQAIGVAERRDDLMAAVFEESCEPLAQQHLVLRDHDPHGSSAIRVVPAPCSLSMRSVPPRATTRSERPLNPVPSIGAAPPTPSSATETTSFPSWRPAVRTILVGRACLTAVVSPSQPLK